MPKVTFIPNDPLASGGPANRQVTGARFPRGDIATLDVRPPAAPDTYDQFTSEFDFWQAQIGLIAGLKTWKDLDGRFLARWFGDQKVLPVFTNSGDDLNAFYDRASLQFFAHTFDGVTVHSAESTDVVTHEQGHAFLDAIRPDFFDVPFIEVGSLHEAFGDCVAILTALNDAPTRSAVLAASPDMSANQFLESVAEQLGDAIRREFGPDTVDAGALRHALNTFRWVDPTTLPAFAPAPELSGEVHSFSRVFTGAFYDVIRNIFLGGPRNSNGLRKAGRTAGRLLVSAIRTVPAAPRTFEGVGQRMVQADIATNNGVNATAIQDAFAAHDIVLPAPSASMTVPLPARRRRGAADPLRERLAVPPDARLEMTPVETDLHGQITHVAAFRPLQLAGDGLEGVRIMVPGVARVARRGRSVTGVIGEVTPSTGQVADEARAFARTLVASGELRTAPRAARRMAGRRMAAPPQPAPRQPHRATHEIQVLDGEPTIRRLGFE